MKQQRPCGIYAITHIVSGRRYIGKTINYFASRWGEHRSSLNRGAHFNSYLQRAWTKYGEAAFAFDVLEDMAHMPREELWTELSVAEVYWLAITPKSYNLTVAGKGGMQAAPETLAKLSAKARLRWADPDYKAKTLAVLRAAMSGDDYHRRRGEAIAAGMNNPEFHAVRSALTAQRWAEGDLRETHRMAMVGHWQEPGFRSRQIATRKANWADPETKARRSAGIQASWDASPERKLARVAAMRAGCKTPIFDTLVAVLRASPEEWRTPQVIREACGERLTQMPSTQVIWQGLRRMVARGEAEKDGALYRLSAS